MSDDLLHVEQTGVRNPRPRILVFACAWCALIGADRAGKRRMQLPDNFRVIPVECAGRVEADSVIKAFASGIDGVAVLGCHLGGCRHNGANHRTAKKLDLLKTLLDTTGIGSERLLTSFGTVHEHHQYAELIRTFCRNMEQLPPVGGRPGHVRTGEEVQQQENESD